MTLQAIAIVSLCLFIIWGFSTLMLKLFPSTEEYDFYGPTIEDEPNYYDFDEKGQEFLRKWHKDYRKLL